LLRENLQNPAPPETSPPEKKKQMKKRNVKSNQKLISKEDSEFFKQQDKIKAKNFQLLSSKPDLVRHKNHALSNPLAASGSERTNDFSSFKAIPTVQHLLELYSDKLLGIKQEPVYVNHPKNQEKTKVKASELYPDTSQDDQTSKKVEASRMMLVKNLEKLIAHQGMDVLSQLTHEMTPGISAFLFEIFIDSKI